MNKAEYLLVCLAEECSEVEKNIAKSLRFGLDNRWPETGPGTNQEKIAAELVDVLAIVELLGECGIDIPINDRFEFARKKAKVNQLMEFSRKSGNLVD